MLASELDFDLPPELIAQEPVRPRDQARLLHLQCSPVALADYRIADLPALLRPDDLLVFNDSRVLRARLNGIKTQSGGRVEAILLREEAVNIWQCLLKPSARIRPGTPLRFSDVDGAIFIDARPIDRTASGWRIEFLPQSAEIDVRDILPQIGQIPLPPYIHREAPESDYQNGFARVHRTPGVALDSAAAPTAGLHFTPQLLDQLQARGIQTAFVTLGVGLGTFQPIQVESLDEHAMHGEEWEVSSATAKKINAQKARGGRVVAVGSTACRVLESVADKNGRITWGSGATSIFMRPGHHFRCIDALITNFHLPRSTLIALVAAFAQHRAQQATQSTLDEALTGLELIRYAYQHAIAARYRFFSFGDAMLIE